MYRALYRKWRPQIFGDVVGQEAIMAALSNQILAERIAHAYLFTGTRGTGKTSCAKIFAKAVNCENRQGAEPCGVCPPCVGLENGSILDVVEIDAASNNSVDNIRDLRDETAYHPSRCRFKVYIIDEVHMLSTSAFNALLKIMEEPPSHVIFILATTEIHKVPATILSRCQRFDFTRIPASKIAERLLYVAQQEDIELSQDAADLISRLADGALRDALSLLDTCAGLGQTVDEPLVRRMAGVSDKGYLFTLSDAIGRADVEELLILVAALREQSIDVRRLTEELVSHYRALMLARAKPDGSLLTQMGESEKAQILAAAPNVDSGFSIAAVRRLAAALDRMGRSPDPRIELELALFDLASPAPAFSPAAQPTQPLAAKAPKESQPARVAPPPEEKAPPAAPPPESFAVQDEIPPAEAPPEVQQAAAELNFSVVPPQAPPEPAVLPEQNQEPPPSGEITLFAQWNDVVAKMNGINRMLHSYMKNSTAYTDGKRVLIDGGDMFLSFMRTDEAATTQIKTVLLEITGVRYGIGPYKTETKQSGQDTSKAKPSSAKETLQAWEKMGVPVEYE